MQSHRCLPRTFDSNGAVGICRIREYGNLGKPREQLAHQLKPLAFQLSGQRGKSRDVATWIGKTRNETDGDGIAACHDYRNNAGCRLGRQAGWRPPSDDTVDGQGNQFGSKGDIPLRLPLCVSVQEIDVLTIDVAEPS